MPTKPFEKLVRENEIDLQRIRTKYFPLIAERIITGYNLYPRLFDYSNGRLFLNYLHSDLRPDDRHFQELSDILRSEGLLECIVSVSDEVVDSRNPLPRKANYTTESDWEDPSDTSYFDLQGNKIPPNLAKAMRIPLVAEGVQYDLLLHARDQKELRRLVTFFKKYTSKTALDRYGKKRASSVDGFEENPQKIANAWDVPLLVCTSLDVSKPKVLRDFLRVSQINVQESLGGSVVVLTTLVRRNEDLLVSRLKGIEVNPQVRRKYVLRGFVDYIEA